jgi:hypothetical protein
MRNPNGQQLRNGKGLDLVDIVSYVVGLSMLVGFWAIVVGRL